MEVENKILHAALASLKPVAREKFQVVRLSAVGSRLSIKASSVKEYAVEEMDCVGDLDTVYVSLQQLTWAIESGAERVTMRIDGTALVVTAKAVCRVAIASPSLFIEGDKPKDVVKHGVNCADLASAIEQVAFCAGSDQDRYQLMSVHVVADEKQIFSESCDGRRAAFCTLNSIASQFSVLCPIETHGNLVDALRRDGAVFSTNERSIKVQHGSGEYSTQQIDAKYMSTESVFKAESKTMGKVPANQIRECVQILQGVTPIDPTKGVWLVLSVDGDGLRIKNDHFDQSVAGDFWLEGTLKFDAAYFRICIDAFKDAEVEVACDVSTRTLVLKGGNLKVVLASQRA